MIDRQRLDKRLADVFKVDANDLKDSSSPETVANWDSLSHMGMILVLEQEFGVSIDATAAVKMRTIGDVYEILTELGTPA